MDDFKDADIIITNDDRTEENGRYGRGRNFL